MTQIFITNLTINKVRHLEKISISLSDERMKHLILTGKNGSGKTGVVEAIADYVNHVFTDGYVQDIAGWLHESKNVRDDGGKRGEKEAELFKLERNACKREEDLNQSRSGLNIRFNKKTEDIFTLRKKNHYILAYYSADRVFRAEQPRHVEKIQLRDHYGVTEFPRNDFVKYLLDLRMTEALARINQKIEKADEIKRWFERLENLLKEIFADETVRLEFDEDTFEFYIIQKGKEPFDFHTLSSGYQAVLDIVLDIMMRMQNQTGRSFDYNLPGIVLVDEIENHLHLELQKSIMPLLTSMFPNIQFIVTSHSPFILNSLKDVVIYDLENNVQVDDGLDNVPYDGIVEGYFGAEKLSHKLKKKFEQYQSLVKKERLSDDEICEIAELEMYLDEIPDYLAFGIAAEYQRLKLEYINREDVDG